VDYLLGAAGGTVTLTVHDRSGNLVQALQPTSQRGINRVVWNLRYAPLPAPAGGGGDDDEQRRGGLVPGPFVMPGDYIVRLTVDGKALEQTVRVSDDPRLDVVPSVREQWTATQLEVAALYRDATVLVDSTSRTAAGAAQDGAGREARERLRVARELQTRLLTLYRAIGGSTGPLTADQRAQIEYFRSFMRLFEARLKAA
jgi:hypothetical protein